VGSALGVAILATILLTVLTSKATSALAAVQGVSKAVSDQVVHIVRSSGGAAIGSLGSLPNGKAIVTATSGAAVDVSRIVAFAAAGFIPLGPIATLLLPRTPVPGTPAPEAGEPEPDAVPPGATSSV
jgi:hypothetical protein